MAIWDIKERYKKVRANEVKGTRGFVSGGQDPGGTSAAIDMLTIETQGSAVDFGDITIATNQLGGGSAGSSTRGFVRFGGENASSYYEAPCEVINIKGGTGAIASTFGTLSVGASGKAVCSNQVRAVMGGGAIAPNGNPQNVIDYFTISSYGNASDFGDLTVARANADALASPTRGIFCGGFVGPNTMKNEMDYISIASTGNASDFGDLDTTKRNSATGSNQTRGIIGGGQVPGNTTAMAHITIATTGNATDFGDLTAARQSAGVSNQIHLLACGGSNVNTIDKISFSNLANGVDFGDLTKTFNVHISGSDGHGGLDNNNYINAQRPSVTYMPGSGRGLIQAVGGVNAYVEAIHIPTLGNTSSFGNLSVGRKYAAGAASLTRGVDFGGGTPTTVNVIDSIEFSSLGNYADFGDTSITRDYLAGTIGSTTRACFAGGYAPSRSNVIDYITIATAGDALDFGDLATPIADDPGGLSSNTRGVIAGGNEPDDADAEEMVYITIASTGNSSTFGDLTSGRTYLGGAASSTRGVFGSGLSTPSGPYGGEVLDYVTIASTGNATDFGDPSVDRYTGAGLSNSTRGVFAGGRLAPTNYNTIDYITIASTGNATDFGDQSTAGESQSTASDNHGGLQN